MEQTTPLPNSSVSPETPIKPLVNLSFSKKPVLIILLIVFVIILTSLVAFAGYFYFKSKSQNISPQLNQNLLQKTESFFCNVDSDCTIGIQTNQCCSCPRAINSKFIGKDNWESYIQGKNYAPDTEECRQTSCKPCQNIGRPACQNKICIMTFIGED